MHLGYLYKVSNVFMEPNMILFSLDHSMSTAYVSLAHPCVATEGHSIVLVTRTGKYVPTSSQTENSNVSQASGGRESLACARSNNEEIYCEYSLSTKIRSQGLVRGYPGECLKPDSPSPSRSLSLSISAGFCLLVFLQFLSACIYIYICSRIDLTNGLLSFLFHLE